MEDYSNSPLVELGRTGRPVFNGLHMEENDGEVGIEASLVLTGKEVTGYAKGGPGEMVAATVAAQAVLRALTELVGHIVDLDLVWVQVGGPSLDRPALAQTLIQVRHDDLEELYVGSALVRGDEAVAVARAVLDALNRPLARYLPG